MITAIAFAAAAVTGALARAEVSRRWNRVGLPLGTLVVNITGSFLLGLLAQTTAPTVTVLGAGGLGAYTTFSTFARDAVDLAVLHRVRAAALYVAATCVLGVASAWVGVAIASA